IGSARGNLRDLTVPRTSRHDARRALVIGDLQPDERTCADADAARKQEPQHLATTPTTPMDATPHGAPTRLVTLPTRHAGDSHDRSSDARRSQKFLVRASSGKEGSSGPSVPAHAPARIPEKPAPDPGRPPRAPRCRTRR